MSVALIYFAPKKRVKNELFDQNVLSTSKTVLFNMEEARVNALEAMTNMETVMGENWDAPFADGASSSSDSLERMLGEEGSQEHDEEEVSFPCHQPEEDDEPWVPTEAEKDAAERKRSAALPRPVAKGVKRPRSPDPSRQSFDAVPDLAEIFDNYDTPSNVRVSICRAYASYVSSTMPRKKKKAAKRVSKK